MIRAISTKTSSRLPARSHAWRQHRGAALALGVAAVAMAACGGGSGPGTSKTHTEPAPAKAALKGSPLTWSDYQLTVPTSMTLLSSGGDGALLQKADAQSSYGFACRIALAPPGERVTGVDLTAQALLALFSMAASGQTVLGEDTNSPLDSYNTGITGEGRDSVQLAGRLVEAGNHNSMYGLVRVLAVDLGSKVAVLSGFQPWDIPYDSRRCFKHTTDPHEWELIAYSLSFPSVPGNPAAFRQALLGGWFGASIGDYFSLGWSDVFAANGQHSSTLTAETYHRVSPTEILQTDSTWFGDSAWSLTGNRISIWPNDPAKAPYSQYARIETLRSSTTVYHQYLYRLSALDDGTLVDEWETKDE
jgi:hypothetical protein